MRRCPLANVGIIRLESLCLPKSAKHLRVGPVRQRQPVNQLEVSGWSYKRHLICFERAGLLKKWSLFFRGNFKQSNEWSLQVLASANLKHECSGLNLCLVKDFP